MLTRFRGSMHSTMPNFLETCLSIAKILQFFDFSRWRQSAILDSFGAHLDYPRWVLVGLYHSAKSGYDRCSSLCNMNISIFGAFGWKMPIHAPKIVFFGAICSPKWAVISPKPKRYTWVRVIWAIKRENVHRAVWSVGELLKQGV